MRISKITVIAIMASVLPAVVMPDCVYAKQKYPTRPIRIVVPSSAGGTLAAQIVTKAAPDGYTQLATSNTFAISAAL